MSAEDRAALREAEARRQREEEQRRLEEAERRRREREAQQAQARVTSTERDVQVRQKYRKGELSGHEARLYVERRLAEQGVQEMEVITEAPEGYYYPDASEVHAYNARVFEYNAAVREYRGDAVRAFTELGAEPEQPKPPYAYGTAQERDRTILLPGEEGAEPVRRVEASQGPIAPFMSEISPAGPELGQPADTRPIYGPGREPTAGEQLLGVAQIPSQIVRGVEAIGAGAIEALPGDRWLELRKPLRVVRGVAGGAATLIDPATYLGLPGAAAGLGAYALTAGWGKISADVSRTLGEYGQTRMANPELLYQDVGFQIGAGLGFKAVTGLASRAARATGGALAGLPSDVLGSRGLATISGESPLGFRQALQVARQRSVGLGRDVLGFRGLAAIGGEALPLKQLIQVIRQRGGLGSDVLGSRGLAVISGGAPYPLRQSLQVWASRASLGNLPGEALGGGLASIGGDPAFMPIKQLLQVVKQKASLGSDVLGPTGMGTRGYSLKALWKFATMPGAVEPFTGVAHRGPAFSTKDISGFLQIKAREQAEMNAAKMQAFMTREFKVAPTGGPALLLQSDVRQLVKMGQGVGAVDVFPYEVLSFPPRDEFIAREALRRVERPAYVPRQEKALKQELRDVFRVGQFEALRPEQLQAQEVKLVDGLRFRLRQPQAPRFSLKTADLQLPGLKLFQAQQQKQQQRQRLMGLPGFMPPGQGLRLPRPGGEDPGLGGFKRRRYKGERRTYPVRDPLSILESFVGKKGKGRRKPRGLGL